MTSRKRTSCTGTAALAVAGLVLLTACGGGDSSSDSSGDSKVKQVGRYRTVPDLCTEVGDPGLPGELRSSIPVTSAGIASDPSKTISCSYTAGPATEDWRVSIDATVFEAARGCHWLEVSAESARSPLGGPKPTESRKFERTDGGGLGQEGYQVSVRHPLTDTIPGPVDQLSFTSAFCDGNVRLTVEIDYGARSGMSADYPGALDKAEEVSRKKAAELLKRAREKLYERAMSPQPTGL
ncbi:hypothetical protein [Kitasatospora purpeofusca]|uniref:hypothetical protein n=1 Tax=Kitasatospora purpeofusca TaxID=67352 RepID=UPI002252A214|nr:hypothetical protein [Kitasatospora purpeofusca]MCX4755230.1 hypothetical protein [Kitasatospora purpeofusca]WSR36889.1 hypothetical protein OG715_41520 [Kitasatospora purpeofusca]